VGRPASERSQEKRRRARAFFTLGAAKLPASVAHAPSDHAAKPARMRGRVLSYFRAFCPNLIFRLS